MKIMHRTRSQIWLSIMVCVILLTQFTACGSSQNNASTNIAEQYLTQMFTTNLDGRYLTAVNTGNVDDYYEPFKKITTDSWFDSMQANRIPFKYDADAVDQNVAYVISDIAVTLEEDGHGTFEVVLIDQMVEDGDTVTATGQISVQNGLVDNFYLSEMK